MAGEEQQEGMKTRRILYMDLETNGLNYRQHEMFQLAAIVHVGGTEHTFVRLIRVSIPLSEVVLRVTGHRYTNEKLAEQPSFPEVMRAFIQWLHELPGQGPLYFLAYNGLKFDFKFMIHQMLRAGLNPYLFGISMFVDLFPWCKRMLHAEHRGKLPMNEKSGEPSFTLSNIHLALVGTAFAAHDALEDVRAMIRIVDVIEHSDLYTPADRDVLYTDPLCIQPANEFTQAIQDDFRRSHSDLRTLVHKAISQKQIIMLQKPGLLLSSSAASSAATNAVDPVVDVATGVDTDYVPPSTSLSGASDESLRDGETRKRRKPSGGSNPLKTVKKRKVAEELPTPDQLLLT
jgi:DNA polymerase III epsilon subunit-like protein